MSPTLRILGGIVVIVAAGIRRDGAKDDIYNLTKKLFRLRLLGE